MYTLEKMLFEPTEIGTSMIQPRSWVREGLQIHRRQNNIIEREAYCQTTFRYMILIKFTHYFSRKILPNIFFLLSIKALIDVYFFQFL